MHISQTWMFIDILSCPEQFHNGTTYKLQTLKHLATLITFKEQLQAVLN